MKKITAICLSCFLFASGAYAIEKVDGTKKLEYENNATISAEMSTTDPNRIIVKGDTILNIQCNNTQCMPSYDQFSGDGFIQLTPAARMKPSIMAFVVTEHNHNFSLVIKPKAIIGQTIEFVPMEGSGSKEAEKFENKTPYQELLVSIVKGMVQYDQNKRIKGYLVRTFEEPTKKDAGSGLTMFPIRLYSGNKFMGLEYGLKNNEIVNKTLTVEEFYRHGVVAGGVSKEVLKPGEIGKLYLVIKKGEV
jgi:conjugal transfer pilus assembly protein TraK